MTILSILSICISFVAMVIGADSVRISRKARKIMERSTDG